MVFYLFRESIINLVPITKNVIDAINFKYISGINVEIEPPANTPIRLAKIRADDAPRKTANGFLELPLKVNVANSVLSPNSAIKIVIKEDINKFIIIFKDKY